MHIKVRVKTGMKKESVREIGKGKLEISVREEAERNEANERAKQLVAAHYRVPTTKVRIVNGHQRPSKLLEILN